MKILLDSEYFTDGIIEEVASELVAEDPEFDVSRLRYDVDDVRLHAKKSILARASRYRSDVVNEPDALRVQGWSVKALLAMYVLSDDDEGTKAALKAQVLSTFEKEAELRGKGESAKELAAKSVSKMIQLFFAQGQLEGLIDGLEASVDREDVPDKIDQVVKQANDKMLS